MSLITISRSLGSGGEVIASKVAKALNLELYDDNKLQQAAIDMGIPADDAKNLNEKAPGLFERLLNRKPETYLELMESVVYDVAHKGQGVIVGHGSQMLLRDFGCAFHVYVHATGPSRVQYIMETKGLNREGAKQLIQKSDHQQKGFFRFAFQMDWNDPSLYDLIVNTEKLGIEAAVKLIVGTAESDQIQACSLTAVEAMERLSQKKRVEAAVLENDINPFLLNIEVPEKGVVRLSGAANSQVEKDNLVDIIQRVSGISEVRNEVGVMPSGI
jgi:cytidylate kinase